VCPSLKAKGGITAVVSSLLQSRLAADYHIDVIETAGEGAVGAVAGIGRTIAGCARASLRAPRVYHVHMSSRGSFWRKAAIATCARLGGSPVVIQIHGSRFHSFAASSPGLGGAVRRALTRADRVVVLSAEWEERILSIAPDAHTVIVPNPVKIPVQRSAALDKHHVVFLGRLGERKGAWELLDAIRVLQEAGVDAMWTLAGDGEVARVREVRASLPRPDLVSVPGWVGDEEKASLLSRADVFVLPSRDEGLPVSMLEAMAYGLACVVTPVGGIPGVMFDRVNGMLVAPGDATGLAGALSEVLEDDELRASIGLAARETAIEQFALERVANRFAALYDELCSNSEREH
jgi:glycosyltransferase involved in cell wall biosynthesis